MNAFQSRISVLTLVVLLLALVAFPDSTPGVLAAPAGTHLSPEEFLMHEPNELGRVPVFMYHNIVPNDGPRGSAADAYMYRTYDQFWNDMLWLYEHDFYLVGMNDLVSGNLDVPPGKHPVVFTFDDASSLHFSYIKNDQGELEIDPNCAVGLMERFYAEHPDFGRGAHFGMVPGNKFSWPANDQDDLFDEKVQWLVENNYEIGNHTITHANLLEIDNAEFVRIITEPVIWADEIMGADNPANASRVLTLPFGIGPTPTVQPDKYQLMTGVMTFEGHDIQLTGVLELVGGSTEVPWSTDWNPYSIPRLPVQDDIVESFREVYLEGENPYYTSDGDPNTVTVPWPLPQAQWGKLNEDAIHGAGKQLVKYNPESGQPMKHHGQVLPPGSGITWRAGTERRIGRTLRSMARETAF